MNPGPSRRPALALAGGVVVALGLAVRSVDAGAVSAVGGDALYAVLVYAVVALVAPRARAVVVAALAWGLCAAVELAQLVGLSAAVVAAWEPARWALGTTFHAPDLLVYAVGAAAAAAVDTVVSGRVEPAATGSPTGRRARRPRPDQPSSPS